MYRLRTIAIEVVVLLLFIFALWLRISPPFNSIFTPEGVRFSTVDAYYHMYVVDNLAHNFPKLSEFLPYLSYPNGQASPAIYFFNWLLSAVIWIVSLGKPTTQIVDVIGAYYPAVLGALTIIPVYFIGKALIGRWAGLISAAIIAILPGEFIGRSILGSTDQHVAESLITTIAMLFLILALKAAKEKKLTLVELREKRWAVIAKPLVYSLLAGFFLGMFLLTWYGALLFVFIIFVFFVIQFFIDHLRRQSTDYLAIVGVIMFAIAAVMFLPVLHSPLNVAAMLIAVAIPVVLNFLSRFMVQKQLKPLYFPLLVVGIGLTGALTLALGAPALFQTMLASFSIFRPTGASLTTLEMQPILVPTGTFTLSLVWGNFTASFFVGFLALIVLIVNPKTWMSWGVLILLAVFSAWLLAYSQRSEIGASLSIALIVLTIAGLLVCLVIRQPAPDKSLLVVWSLIILTATIGQRRFAYYFAVNAAVLTGYFCAWLFEKGGLLRPDEENTNQLFTATLGVIAILFLIPSVTLGFLTGFTWIGVLAAVAFFIALFVWRGRKVQKELKTRRTNLLPRRRLSLNTNAINLTLAMVLVFLVVLFPNVSAARQTAQGASFAPSDAWMNVLSWIRNNTPDPFDNPDHYYELTDNTVYPTSAYGVLSWWDYGYWITRISHRIPNVNPSQDAIMQNKVGNIFTAQNEIEADVLARTINSNYVVIDDQTALGKFWAVATWAGKSPSEFSEVFYLPQPGPNGQTQFTPVQLYSPEYYRSFVIRLFNFDGKARTQNLTAPQIATISQWLVGNLPPNPSSLSANASGAGQVDLDWTANITDVSSFRIERSTDSTFNGGIVSIKTSATSTGYADTSVDPGTTYYYRIFAVNPVGESSASSSVSITTPPADTAVQPPAAPAAENATTVDKTAVTVTWKDSSDSETGFRIDRSTANSFNTDLISTTVGANVTSWTDTTVSGNTTYYYRIVAYNDGGNSPASDTVSAIVGGGTLEAPTIYATNCASCHGSNREGSGTTGPALIHSALSGKSTGQLSQTIAEGTTNGMPGFLANQVYVVTWQVDPQYNVKIITDAQPFETYAEADAFLQTNNSSNSRIVGPNPFVSPVPLEGIQNYKLVYGSPQLTNTGIGVTSQVKVFQYTGNITQ